MDLLCTQRVYFNSKNWKDKDFPYCTRHLRKSRERIMGIMMIGIVRKSMHFSMVKLIILIHKECENDRYHQKIV